MDNYIAVAALLVSVASLAIAGWHWSQSNRPVVTVRIRTHKGGNVTITYLLEVLNSGTRPACNVRLQVSPGALEGALADGAREHRDFEAEMETVRRCFQERACIPVLPNGEVMANSFGHTSLQLPFWKPGAVLAIGITYEGLQGQQYKDRVRIRIDDSAAFAGGGYMEPPEPRY